jgi:hypothetical protein
MAVSFPDKNGLRIPSHATTDHAKEWDIRMIRSGEFSMTIAVQFSMIRNG